MTGDGINDGRRCGGGHGIAMAPPAPTAREAADIVLGNDDLDGVIEVRLGRATYANIRKVGHPRAPTHRNLVMLGASIAGCRRRCRRCSRCGLISSDAAGAGPRPGAGAGAGAAAARSAGADPGCRRLPAAGARRRCSASARWPPISAAAKLSAAADTTPSRGRTLVFHGLTLRTLHALACRSDTHGLIEEMRRTPNPKLYAALAASLCLQAGAQAVPFLRRLLGLAPLDARGFGVILAAALGPLVVNEVLTALLRRPDGLPEA
jgi:Ca2+-transporting ATPase